MATFKSLQHNFDKPLQDNPTLLESLSWNRVNPAAKTIEQPSVTEIFGELEFRENPVSSPPPSFPLYLSSAKAEELNDDQDGGKDDRKSQSVYSLSSTVKASYYSMNSERLQLCTEGLGFESFEDTKNETNQECHYKVDDTRTTKHLPKEHISSESRRFKTGKTTFPPPISSMGKNGKPWVCFKSYRQGGRFVLKEIRIPSQEFFQACREDGRLKLQFVHPQDELLEGEAGEEPQYPSDEEDAEETDNSDYDNDSSSNGEANIDVNDNADNVRDDPEEEDANTRTNKVTTTGS